MQVIETTIFKCDYCGKRQFRKGDMTLHERWCSKNPNNKHKCFQYCKHLVKSEEEYEVVSDYSDEGYTGKRTVFTCGVTLQKMFSFLAERRKLPVINEPDTIRMPLSCDLYQTEYGEAWEVLDYS